MLIYSANYDDYCVGYRIVDWKMREYVVPDLTGFKLKPYVSLETPDIEEEQGSGSTSPVASELPASESS